MIKLNKKNLLKNIGIALIIIIVIIILSYVIIVLLSTISGFVNDKIRELNELILVITQSFCKMTFIGILISKKFNVLKFTDIIKLDTNSNKIIFNDQSAKIKLGLLFDLFTSTFYIWFFFILFTGNIISIFLLSIFTYYLLISPFFILILNSLEIIFTVQGDILIIEKKSYLRKIFKLKSRWEIKINKIIEVKISLERDKLLILKCKNEKEIDFNFGFSRNSFLIELKDILHSILLED